MFYFDETSTLQNEDEWEKKTLRRKEVELWGKTFFKGRAEDIIPKEKNALKYIAKYY